MKGTNSVCEWNKSYEERAKSYPDVAICNIFNNHLYLHNPPALKPSAMKKIFKNIPGTRNPRKLKEEEWSKFQILIENLNKG